MDWKGFLKPNKWKLIILVILIVITYISYFGNVRFIECLTDPCPQPFPSGNRAFILTNYALTFPSIWINHINLVQMKPLEGGNYQYVFLGIKIKYNSTARQIKKITETIFGILSLIVALIYQYLLSCLMFYGAKRIRAK